MATEQTAPADLIALRNALSAIESSITHMKTANDALSAIGVLPCDGEQAIKSMRAQRIYIRLHIIQAEWLAGLRTEESMNAAHAQLDQALVNLKARK